MQILCQSAENRTNKKERISYKNDYDPADEVMSEENQREQE